jgi:AraC-like DNA-binding protein
MIALHQVRAVALTGYVEVAGFLGLDAAAMLKAARIDPRSLGDPEARLPATRFVQLLEDSARRSRCESLGLLMAECRTFESLGPLALLVGHLGSAREAIEALIVHRRMLNDILVLDLDPALPDCIRMDVLPQFGSNQAIDMAVAIGQIVLSGASRQIWRPRVVHFQHAAPRDSRIFRRLFPAPVQFGSSFTGFECAEGALDARWPGASEVMAAHAQRLFAMAQPAPRDISTQERVSRAISLLLPVGRATLEGVADSLSCGARALQRTLEKEGSSFGILLNKARRELALRYLANDSQSITSVAELTGYSSSSSFARWFSSEFGIAPRDWRCSLIEQSGYAA